MAEGSDHIKSEISPPGGHLELFVNVWDQNECHPRAALILRHSYKIVLKQPIKLSVTPTIHYANRQKQKFLLACLREMLQKDAINPVRMSATLGFYSKLFLVPKPE